MGQAYRFLGALAALPLVSTLLLSGCASTADSDGYYTVRRGDTLYSIGRDFDQSPANLRAWNRLRNPDDLDVGQRLLVRPPVGVVARTGAGQTPRPTASSPGAASASRKSTGRPAAKPSSKSHEEDDAPAPADARLDWMWPTQGKSAPSADSYKKGIDIVGSQGQPVVAAAAGKVTYAGHGIRGYGNMVIIKHTPQLLSVYAHNATITVKEGQMVTRGQQIATMGNSDTNKVKLYFEIRRNGKPVNVMALLPAR
ncbi:NlpD lipoprotein [Herbaspirillum sp. GW103]|uniref:peptidoglycan DD-metalloendopeptidase family protein n=1 Tax=unclassified Herbaspirillum TaxID=2624150 RepID=UPI00025E413D|nr:MULTISPECIES: peptidoglycan DD-metalloendopeptidase family protein [unclassified Herbaspirillum]EIJ46146.1 NlpD lipoprotein [Herbaspirillum sp. GW103]MCI1003550.1 peptidoglycan DD-metalloendopeptidase family protein [Herbaspirillum sp. C7C8]NUT62998.1 peptidoglycan DD-metalloendopeptidase family protein [Herbaspirillum sp. C9C3]